ncbi:hypothetical protein Ciccas_007382 [Cichlidogyrus casuarinus]|uniref:Ubiquitin-like domain-containing protein n=1 Tax=Cichlidogyrus casuarinus TaxID=1844966 RepID=A0ABD2Q3R9_9PLAT
MALKILIRSPDSRYDLVSLTVSPTITIKELKQLISSQYSDEPGYESQRLISSGRLLSNEEIVNNIFKDDSEQHIVHVVFSNAKVPLKPTKKPNNDVDLETTKKEYFEYLKEFYRNNPTQQTIQIAYNFGEHAQRPGNANWVQPQENAVQEPQPVFTRRIVQTIVYFLSSIRSLFYLRRNEEPEDGMPVQRDIIDLIFMSFRVFLLIMLMGQVPSYKSNFLVACVLVYFIHRFLLRFIQRARDRVNQPNAPPQQQPARPQNQSTIDAENSEADLPAAVEPEVNDIQNPVVSVLRASMTTVFAFFASLLPEDVGPLVVN